MGKDRRKLKDRELLDRFLSGPDSYEGKMAMEELRFRNYLAFMRYNRWLIALTSVLALVGLIDAIISIVG